MNKRHLIIAILGILLLNPGFPTESRAQVCNGILREIGQNNLQLQALRQHAEAEKAAARAGIFNHQPEVEFAYLWGNPSSIGRRIDLNASQAFDFPTAWLRRRQISEGQCLSADLEYEIRKRQVMEQAGDVCLQIIACNRLQKELGKRLTQAERMNAAYREMFSKGETGILDARKAALNEVNERRALEENGIRLRQLRQELQGLNGGKEISLEDTVFPSLLLPDDFENWYASLSAGSPVLKNIENRQTLQQRQVQLQKSLCLPGFSVGFRSEAEQESAYRGVGIGLSIPLWGNVRQLQAAKAEAEAERALAREEALQFSRQLQILYEKALSLQKLSETYRQNVGELDSGELLRTALEKGEISLIQYLNELTIYNEAVSTQIQTEESFLRAAFQLMVWSE